MFRNKKFRDLEMKCCLCGKTRRLFDSSTDTIESASERLLLEGWNATNSKPLCPDCNSNQRVASVADAISSLPGCYRK